MQQQTTVLSTSHGSYLSPGVAFSPCHIQQIGAVSLNGLPATPIAPASGEGLPAQGASSPSAGHGACPGNAVLHLQALQLHELAPFQQCSLWAQQSLLCTNSCNPLTHPHVFNTHPLALGLCIFASVLVRKDWVPSTALDSEVSSAVVHDHHPTAVIYIGFKPLSEQACVMPGAVQTQIEDAPPQSSDSTQDWQFFSHSSH